MDLLNVVELRQVAMLTRQAGVRFGAEYDDSGQAPIKVANGIAYLFDMVSSLSGVRGCIINTHPLIIVWSDNCVTRGHLPHMLYVPPRNSDLWVQDWLRVLPIESITEVLDRMSMGADKINTIRWLRDKHAKEGMGLLEAKDIVDWLIKSGPASALCRVQALRQ